MPVSVITDSGSDITQEHAQELGITVVPLYVRFGSEVLRDGVDIYPDDFYRSLVNGTVHPNTSSPSPGDFAQVYEQTIKKGHDILSIHVTRKHSATYNSAVHARELFGAQSGRIEVLDSEGVTMWQGLVVMAAAKAAKAGDSLSQVAQKARQTIAQLRGVGLLDTFTYIVKGGRLSRAISSIESVFKVKPLITLKNGEIRPFGVVRTRKKGIEKLQELVRDNIEELAIVYSTTAEEAQSFAEYVKSIVPRITPRIYRLGPALGVHGGPGTLIVAVQSFISATTGSGNLSEKAL